MRIQEYNNGDLDEFIMDGCEVFLERTGVSKYKLFVSGSDTQNIIQI